jgi:tetratricopeptide (TPR) repeat protein
MSKVRCSFGRSSRASLYVDYLYKFVLAEEGGKDFTFYVGFFTAKKIERAFIKMGFVPSYTFKPFNKLLAVFLFVPLFLYMCFLIYIQLPAPKLQGSEAEYMAAFNSGYKSFQNNDCNEALLQYDKAQRIISSDSELYLMKSYCYAEQRNYIRALEEINIAEDLYKKKVPSTYAKANKFLFFDDKVSIYREKGKIDYNLKNYGDSVADFDKEIEAATYKYTDAYFLRGRSKYYNNDKVGALADFIKHEQIITTYLNDQAGSQYKDKYPSYSNSGLVNVAKWIKACKV